MPIHSSDSTPNVDEHSSPESNSGSDAESTLPSQSSPGLDVVWQQFGAQFRRRARTRLRQYGLTGQTESMDICNDVMVDLARRHEKTNSTSVNADDVLSYIMRAIDNQVMDTFRTLARQCRDFRRTDATPIDDMPVATHATTPSQVALRKEVIARIRALLGPEDARVVDMMLENRDWKEIGKVVGQKPDTVRMRVRRALDRIRGEIGVGGVDE